MRWPLIVRQVAGHSMEPEIMAGQYIVGSGWLPLRVGAIVIAKADGREVIKRILAIKGRNIVIQGDNNNHTKNYIIKRRDVLAIRFM